MANHLNNFKHTDSVNTPVPDNQVASLAIQGGAIIETANTGPIKSNNNNNYPVPSLSHHKQ